MAGGNLNPSLSWEAARKWTHGEISWCHTPTGEAKLAWRPVPTFHQGSHTASAQTEGHVVTSNCSMRQKLPLHLLGSRQPRIQVFLSTKGPEVGVLGLDLRTLFCNVSNNMTLKADWLSICCELWLWADTLTLDTSLLNYAYSVHSQQRLAWLMHR